jgi:hypothetical protein
MAKRTKGLKWHMSTQERRVDASWGGGVKLVWLRPGALAHIVRVERTRKGWSSEKNVKVIGLCTILQVYGESNKGFSQVLRDGQIENVSNMYLRPMQE